MFVLREAFLVLRLLANPRLWPSIFRTLTTVLRHVFRSGFQPGEGPSGAGAARGSRRARLAALITHYRRFRLGRWTWHRGRLVESTFVPPFPSRAFDRALESVLSGQLDKPMFVHLAVTSACPAGCGHCSLRGRTAANLPTAKWVDVIAQLNGLGVSTIALTGGEPATRDDLPQLVQAAHDGGAAVQLFTSGIGLTAARIGELQEAGLGAIGVSLDHTCAAVVDQQRCWPGAFDAAVAALRHARRTGMYTFINAVADRASVISDEPRRLLELASRLGIDELRLLEPVPCGGLIEHPDRLLQPEHVAELRRLHHENNRRRRGPKLLAISEIESREMHGCVAGSLHLFVDPRGDVCPCDFVPWSFGNVLHTPLEAIWRNMRRVLGTPRTECLSRLLGQNPASDRPKQPLGCSPDAAPPSLESLPGNTLPGFYGQVMAAFGLSGTRGIGNLCKRG